VEVRIISYRYLSKVATVATVLVAIPAAQAGQTAANSVQQSQAEPISAALVTAEPDEEMPCEAHASPGKPTLLQVHVTKPGLGADATAQPSGLFDVTSQLKPDLVAPPKQGPVRAAASKGISLANFVFDFRGFDISKEGANVALNEKVKPNNQSAKELLSRASLDQKELDLVGDILKIADTLSDDSVSAISKRSAAMSRIQSELGEDSAINICSRLKDMQSSSFPESKSNQCWDLTDRDKKCKQIFDAAADSDPVVKDLKQKLHKYNNRNKVLSASAKVVYTAANIAACTPTLAAPMGEATMLAFMMATGGPEQDKLLREVYLMKELESRYQLIQQKSNLIAESYNRALATHNATLLSCTRELLRVMTNEHIAADVFETAATGICHEEKSPVTHQLQIAMPETVTE
jgi:hypothetical protein